MQNQIAEEDDYENALKKSVSLYPEHIRQAQTIRKHYRLKSMAAAIQRAIEDKAAELERERIPA